MSGIEGKKGYYLQKTGARVNELLERHYIVPTFTTSPTEDTLSWDDEGHIIYFRVGEIIRVKTPEGYDFYRVNDIKDDRINWVKIDTLSDTYTKGEIDVKFFTKEDASGYISEKLVNYYSKREVDGKIEQTNKSVLEQTERVDNLGVELKNKASAEQVNKLESGLETTKKSIAEQTTKVTALQSEIKTKASTQSVTQLGDSVNIISDTVAEQTIRTDELEASIETKVSQEIFDATTGDINSEFIAVKQTTDAIETAVKAQSGEITAISESVNGLSISLGTIESDLDSLRNQMDGTTESYFEKWIPTNENEPAKTWIEQGKQAEHKGDTFTNTSLDGEDAGKSWRWLQDDNGNWGWQPIADTDALKALEAAAKAQAAADGKVTIYYEQPSNYKKGDIWFVHNNSYSPYKQGEILSAKTENTVFYISDWESKTRYTQAVEDLNDVMITTFKDGVLTEAERISIIESITSIANEQAAVQARYNIIIINANLTDETLKNEFKATKVAYDAACTSLINIVEQIADAKEENLESLFDSYTQLSDDYSEAYATHNEKESEINNALMGRLNPANVYIDNITDDGILTPIEKEQLFEIYRNIAKEYDATRSNALNYKVWKYSNDGVTEESGLNGGEGRYNNYISFKSAYNNVASVFGSSVWGFTNMKESTTLPSGYSTTVLKGYLDTYYGAYGDLTKSFSAITAAIESAQKATEATLKGLTDNLLPEEQITTIGKGVVLSTIIATKDSSGKVTAGMNASSVHSDSTHGRVVFVGGAKDLNDFTKASFVVYEDGHVNMSSASIGQYASKSEVTKSIEEVQELANTAKTAASAAQTLASTANTTANAATTRLNSWASDKVISPVEKQGIKDELAFIVADKNDIDKQVSKYSLSNASEYTTFVSKYTTYKGNLDTIIAATTDTVSIPTGMANNQSEYYSARTSILSTIATKAKEIADNAQALAGEAIATANEAKSAISDVEYLAQTFGPLALDVDGVVMSEMVAVKNSDGEVEAFLNGSDFAEDVDHGKLLLAGGIPSGTKTLAERTKASNTRIYEDGYLQTQKGKISFLDVTEQELKASVREIHSSSVLGDTDYTLKDLVFSKEGLTISTNRITNKYLGGTTMTTSNGGFLELNPNKIAIFNIVKSTINGTNVVPTKTLAWEINKEAGYNVIHHIGMYEGLRPKSRAISSGDTDLDEYDHTIFAVNRNSTIYLPASPVEGQEYVVLAPNGGVTIDGNGKGLHLFHDGIDRSAFTCGDLGTRVEARLYWNKDDNKWWVTTTRQ